MIKLIILLKYLGGNKNVYIREYLGEQLLGNRIGCSIYQNKKGKEILIVFGIGLVKMSTILIKNFDNLNKINGTSESSAGVMKTLDIKQNFIKLDNGVIKSQQGTTRGKLSGMFTNLSVGSLPKKAVYQFDDKMIKRIK